MSDDIIKRLLGNCDCVDDELCFDCEITKEITGLNLEIALLKSNIWTLETNNRLRENKL